MVERILDGNIQRLCVIGSTGTGKSATCNSLCGKDLFPSSAEATSKTFETTMYSVHWQGKTHQPKFLLIDTPGLGDTLGRDSLHIADMTEKLKETQFVNGFLIVFNGQNPRFDEHL